MGHGSDCLVATYYIPSKVAIYRAAHFKYKHSSNNIEKNHPFLASTLPPRRLAVYLLCEVAAIK